MEVKFINLVGANFKAWRPDFQGLFVNLTSEARVGEMVYKPALYFGGNKDWEILSNDTNVNVAAIQNMIADAVNALNTTESIVTASVDNGVVTLTASIAQEDGIITKGSGDDITLAKVATTGLASDITVVPIIAGAQESDLQTVLAAIVSTNSAAIEALDADVTSADYDANGAEGKKNVQVQVVEEDGKITSVVVTENTVNKKKYAEDKDAIEERIKANEDAIGVINGEGEGSIKKAAADAVATVVAKAPEDFDTLKEVADWIANDTTGAAKMQSDIATLQGGDTVEGSVAHAIKVEKDRAESVESDFKSRIETLEGIAGDTSIVSQIKTAVEALDATVKSSDIGCTPGTNVEVEVVEEDGKITKVNITKDTTVNASEYSTYKSETSTAIADAKKAGTDADAKAIALDKATNEKFDAAVQTLTDNAYVGVENSSDGQYVKVSNRESNKQSLSVTLGSFATSEKEQVNGLATIEAVKPRFETSEGKISTLEGKVSTLEGAAYTTVSGDTASAYENSGVNVNVKVTEGNGTAGKNFAVSATAQMVWLEDLPGVNSTENA